MPHSKTSAALAILKKCRTGRSVSRGAQVRLQERDLWCLEAVAKFRFMTTDQILQVYFSDAPHYGAKRLRRLVDAGLLRVFLRSLAETNIYAITREGLRRLRRSGNDQPEEIQVPKALDGNLDHLLGINGLRCTLALGLGNLGASLAWWRSDWEMSRIGKMGAVPDAIFAIRWDWGEKSIYALELENSTRAPRAFAKKILAYHKHFRQTGALFGFDKCCLLIVATRSNQLSSYRGRTKILGQTSWIWFVLAHSLTVESLAQPLWQSATEDDYLSLRELSYLSLQ